MPLAYPKLKLPDSPEKIAFRTVERMLTSDPVLQMTVHSWNTWKGDPTDVIPPTYAICPYIRISPTPEASFRYTETEHRMPLDVRIQAAVCGSDFDQLTNFWGAIRTAIYPVIEPRRSIVLEMANHAKIARGQMILNGYGWKQEEGPLRIMIAQGTLQVVLLIRTM